MTEKQIKYIAALEKFALALTQEIYNSGDMSYTKNAAIKRLESVRDEAAHALKEYKAELQEQSLEADKKL